jgi:hypothetical protein
MKTVQNTVVRVVNVLIGQNTAYVKLQMSEVANRLS